MDLMGLHFLIYCSLSSFAMIQPELENDRNSARWTERANMMNFVSFFLAPRKVIFIKEEATTHNQRL